MFVSMCVRVCERERDCHLSCLQSLNHQLFYYIGLFICPFAQAGRVIINLIVVGSGMLAKAFVQAYRQALASKLFSF